MLLTAFPFFGESQPEPYNEKARSLVAEMTLEEKAGLCSGHSNWMTKAIDRLSIPAITMMDGPHGLRKSGEGFGNSIPATCFPTASAIAASWDLKLAESIGQAIGQEAQDQDVQLLLGPGVNMKRSPLGGRNFEYYSEDPVLSGKMAAAFIRGVQSEGVGTSLKHFAVNNQEFERMGLNAIVDERSLREIYFPAFEIAVKEAQPWSVMCAYNRINGVFGAEHTYFLYEVLKKEWGFEGFVVSDWGAVHNRVAGIRAGLHLEMPSSGGLNDAKVVEAVQSGVLLESRLDEVVTELLTVILKATDQKQTTSSLDYQPHHQLARKAAADCMVLLKNENDLLPIDTNEVKHIAVVGQFAKTPRYQGAGSSFVNPTELSTAFDSLKTTLGSAVSLSFAPGYTEKHQTDEALQTAAIQLAKKADLCIVFAGLPDHFESEGFDRAHIDLPDSHNELITAITATQPNTAVVLMNGSAVRLPWANEVPAILEAWLTGQAGGAAIADVLTGAVNPSGKLSETFPNRLEDTPTFFNFPGENKEVRHGEGLFIGYRYYDSRKIEPQFSFGHGLSYTDFSYQQLICKQTAIRDRDPLLISIEIENTGKVAGKEVVQLYVRDRKSSLQRPDKELKHFQKTELQPGERKQLNFTLGYRDFAFYDPAIKDWKVESGTFDILIGSSSRDIRLQTSVEVEATREYYPQLDRSTMIKAFPKFPNGQAIYDELMASMLNMMTAGEDEMTGEQKEKADAFMKAVLDEMPVYKLVQMSQGTFSEAMLQQMLERLNPIKA